MVQRVDYSYTNSIVAPSRGRPLLSSLAEPTAKKRRATETNFMPRNRTKSAILCGIFVRFEIPN